MFTCTGKLVLILCITFLGSSQSQTFTPQQRANYETLHRLGNYYTGADAWHTELDPYLQPSDVGKNPIYDEYLDDGIICTRDCTAHPEPRICYYKFVVEQYTAMGPACDNCSATDFTDCYKPQCVQADGNERTVLTVNRMIPGPTINICQGDRIVVDVFNKMPARSLTIHWHGVLQYQSPWMDGVPYVNQCPIQYGAKFRYDFLGDICGTHFYHSHVGAQILDGLFGALIIRQVAALDPHTYDYDFDSPSNTVVINDWNYLPSDTFYPGYNKNRSMPTQAADNYLINGRGAYTARNTIKTTGTPRTIFRVRSGFRYRFRFIAATSFTCSFRAAIQGHTMDLIAVDGNPCYTQEVGTLFMVAGDRFDVVIKANQRPGSYHIVVHGQQECDVREQVAYLVYDDINPLPVIPYDINTIFKPPVLDYVQHSCVMNNYGLCTSRIESIYPVPRRLLNPEPDVRLFLSARGHQFTVEETFDSGTYPRFSLPAGGPSIGGGIFTDMFNNISSIFPPFNLQTQHNIPFPPELLCPKVCTNPICVCLHLIKLPLNAVTEIVLTDDLSTNTSKFFHPQHLHGQHFVVLKQGTKKERQQPFFWKNIDFDRNPLTRDVNPVPAEGFSVIRFEANNPGYWIFHCHFHFHLEGGMFVVFQVGEHEQFLPAPADFPTCGDYMPYTRV